ncbi:MAG: hypothetical protein Q8N10_03545 [Phenylobacterium sp.]|uniref:hypothetical protein n=1 Tax=Phenylobacterium sp. TaxID=1871053 RepID=UPI002722A6DE|nr:hypothetical protein [Phenylobacterium sp.]MDO8912345.1 hypothetical protein [Phenylobacterium sp.]MDO9248717.1 hypothetical protein [Phenylobacterium sp.]MDP2008741.1 hypothetical protein [Phenylobacterium sp.]MDP3099557.1 hypothetical protein [Phenylobacterium sp.]MDP3867134.1 hypothetical protein [Phenylobacterium sp.]
MKLYIHVIAALALGTLASGCATQQTARLDAAQTLAAAPGVPHNASMETGLTSLRYGDLYTATNLLERAVAARPSLRNRFNLAVGYENTARRREAAEIYRGLVRDGQYAYLDGTLSGDGPSAPRRRFNVADEAQQRLALIENSSAPQRTIVTARSAEEAAIPASATVGSPRARISDSEAARLDGIS